MMNTSPPIRWIGVCIDCADADQLADFYSRLLGWPITAGDGEGWAQLRDPNGAVGMNIQAEPWYQPPTWPETTEIRPGIQHKIQHKMMHLEIEVDDIDAAIETVLDAGGTIASHQPAGRNPSRIRVMLDPAGHPFCLFLAGE